MALAHFLFHRLPRSQRRGTQPQPRFTQIHPVPGKHGTMVPERARASTERGRSRTLPPRHSPTPAAHGNVRQRHHLCLLSQIDSNNNKAEHLGTSSRLFWKKSKLPQRDGFFLHWLCILAKVSFSGLRCLRSSPLLPIRFTYSEQQFAREPSIISSGAEQHF